MIGLHSSNASTVESMASRVTAPAPAVVAAEVARAGDAEKPKEHQKLEEAARQFEAVLLRQMLKGLERTTKAQSADQSPVGQSEYGSLVVDAVAESLSRAGGLGLAELLARKVAADPRMDGAAAVSELRGVDRRPGASGSLEGVSAADEEFSKGRQVHDNVALSRARGVAGYPHTTDLPQGYAGRAVPADEIRPSAHGIQSGQVNRRIR